MALLSGMLHVWRRLRLYLYHFPQMAGVGLSRSLVHRLVKAFPKGVVAGMKDSSGHWDNSRILIEVSRDQAVDHD